MFRQIVPHNPKDLKELEHALKMLPQSWPDERSNENKQSWSKRKHENADHVKDSGKPKFAKFEEKEKKKERPFHVKEISIENNEIMTQKKETNMVGIPVWKQKTDTNVTKWF